MLDKGTDRRDYLRGAIDKYTWLDLGSSFGISDYLAAILYRRLAASDRVQDKRRAVASAYETILAPEQHRLGFTLPHSPEGAVSAHHLYYLLLSTPLLRDELLSRLRQAGIGASSHFVPLHRTPGGLRWSVQHPPCPVSERVASSIVRLPLHQEMTQAETERTASQVLHLLRAMRQK